MDGCVYATILWDDLLPEPLAAGDKSRAFTALFICKNKQDAMTVLVHHAPRRLSLVCDVGHVDSSARIGYCGSRLGPSSLEFSPSLPGQAGVLLQRLMAVMYISSQVCLLLLLTMSKTLR
jgi:hypothetical protein